MSEVELLPASFSPLGLGTIAHEDGEGSAWPILLVDRPCRARHARLELGPVSRHNHSKGQG